jgi:hypothetical protein
MDIIASYDFADTIYFKTLCPDYTSFTELLTNYTNVDTTDSLHAYLYKYLFNHYCNSNVNYDTPSAFFRQFGLTYENVYYKYKKQVELIELGYSLTADDLIVVNKTINAIANNPATTVPDVLNTMIEYTDQQAGSQAVRNKLEAYIDAIDNLTDKVLEMFIHLFDKHFISVYPFHINIYDDSEE